jgi:hypothetical protein
MTVTTNEHGQQNMFAKEPRMIVEENYVPHNDRAELLHGRDAMFGIIAAFVSYALTGKLFFGVW